VPVLKISIYIILQIISVDSLVGWCYTTPSKEEGVEKLHGELRPSMQAMPQGLDKRLRMEEVVPTMTCQRGSYIIIIYRYKRVNSLNLR